MKKILTLSLFAAISMTSAWAESFMQLVVTLTDNTTQTFWLKDEPMVAFGATTFIVKAGETQYEAERKQLKTFTFVENAPEGVHSVGAIVPSTGVNRLYDINGRLVQEGEINTTNLPAGQYILQAPGKQSIKILKK